jgi:hypothetical protein
MLTPLLRSVTKSDTTSEISAASKMRSMVAWSIIAANVNKTNQNKG